MPLDDVFDYFREYDKHTFQVVACQGSEPSDSDLTSFESKIGFRLPEDFRDFTMSGLGGLYMEVREELWPRPKLYEVGPFWTFLYGLMVFGIAEGIPDWLDIRVQYSEFRLAGHEDLVPFLKLVGDAERYCFNQKGQIVRWSHEEPDEREVEALAFGDLLMREIRELEARKDRKARQESA